MVCPHRTFEYKEKPFAQNGIQSYNIGQFCKNCGVWLRLVLKEEFIKMGYELSKEPKEKGLFG